MIEFPTIIVSAIIGLAISAIWWYKRKRKPQMIFVLVIILSIWSFLIGLSYIYFSAINYLTKYFDVLTPYQLNISPQEIISTASIVGVIFIMVGIDQLIKNWKKTR